MQAVLACDTERLDLLKEEQALLQQLNAAQPAAEGTAEAAKPATNSHDESRGVNGAAAKEVTNDGISKGAAAGLAADAAESKAAAQLAQVQQPLFASDTDFECDVVHIYIVHIHLAHIYIAHV